MPNDRSHEATLLRDLHLINARTQVELGPLPQGGLPAQTKRKPQLSRPTVFPAAPEIPLSDEDTTMQWKSVATTAALAAAAALTACGANGAQAPHSAPPAADAAEAPASTQMPTIEAAATPERQAAIKPATTVEDGATEPARGGAIPAAELRRRVLALLRSLRTLEDLERENVERMLGIEFKKASDMRQGYEYDGATSEGWTFGVLNAKLGRLHAPSTTIIGLHHGVEPWTDQQPTYCTLEFEPLAKELVAMGYEQDARAFNRGGDMTWGFGRRDKDRNAGFGIEVLIFDVVLENGIKTTCIEGFRIGGGGIDG
jgi:predicted small lipoprotein YifL